MQSNEMLEVARLALEGKPSDVRLYLAKLVRKARKEDPEYASKLEELLKTDPARSNGILRKNLSAEERNLQRDELSLLRETQSTAEQEPLLDSALEAQLQQILMERQHAKELEHKGLKPTSSMIFQGPPGVGKTMTASWLARQLALPLYVLDLTAVMSSLLGKTGSNLRSVLDFAKSHPCVLFLDEIDAIAKKRSDESDVGELKRLVNILLQEIENWPNQGLLIAATNHPELVDPALWRRFDLDVTFCLPREDNVRKAIVEFLGADLNEFSHLMDFLVDTQKGESYSNIKRTINRLRKLKIINPEEFENSSFKCIIPNIDGLSRQERISFAVKLVSDFSFPKQRAAKLLRVSRDTIRKKIGESQS
ncbi:MAG: AAA family ATPase [Sedimenticola thiotaurini]|uniref:AAA family ATPase n=1 Tax=Sedimenticola thiotaurini TaxID=1543721 RepID=A0A558CTD2_9GAMM|nr:MAG: AAA family ATPase [Sedimenticola thiotaurini]